MWFFLAVLAERGPGLYTGRQGHVAHARSASRGAAACGTALCSEMGPSVSPDGVGSTVPSHPVTFTLADPFPTAQGSDAAPSTTHRPLHADSWALLPPAPGAQRPAERGLCALLTLPCAGGPLPGPGLFGVLSHSMQGMGGILVSSRSLELLGLFYLMT